MPEVKKKKNQPTAFFRVNLHLLSGTPRYCACYFVFAFHKMSGKKKCSIAFRFTSFLCARDHRCVAINVLRVRSKIRLRKFSNRIRVEIHWQQCECCQPPLPENFAGCRVNQAVKQQSAQKVLCVVFSALPYFYCDMSRVSRSIVSMFLYVNPCLK